MAEPSESNSSDRQKKTRRRRQFVLKLRTHTTKSPLLTELPNKTPVKKIVLNGSKQHKENSSHLSTSQKLLHNGHGKISNTSKQLVQQLSNNLLSKPKNNTNRQNTPKATEDMNKLSSSNEETNYRTRLMAGTNHSLTVVTMYFNLGDFAKYNPTHIRTSAAYRHWLLVYGKLMNPVVFYTDSKDFAKYFAQVRKNLMSRTKIILLSREELWSFRILPRIAKIYSSKEYPKFIPHTTFPEYTSVTCSKLTLVVDAIKRKIFHTDYFSFFDLGYFRDIMAMRRDLFWESVPSDFDPSRIGVTQVDNKNRLTNITAKEIMHKKWRQVAGGLFLGKPDVFMKFEKEFKQATLRFLDQNIMNTEEMIMYAMYIKSERDVHPLDVDFQFYYYTPDKPKVLKDDMHYLGNLMYDRAH